MTRTRLAWPLLGISVVAMAAAMLMWIVLVEEPFTPDIALFPLAYLAFAIVGATILSRRADNRIGWLAIGAGLGGSIVGLADSYARQPPGALGQGWAAWLAAVGFPATLGPIIFVLLLFPSGRLASRRWRWVGWVTLIGVVSLTVGNAFTPTFADYPGLANPLGIPAFEQSLLDQGGAGWFAVVAGAVLAAAGLAPRLRRATGVERQQLKWITYAATLHGISWILLAIDLPGALGDLAKYVVFGTLTLIPLAAGIAILRYRLYDIDVVIRRTLVYAGVVAILAVAYVVLVLVLQGVLSRATGGQALPVALSTLATAALFGPVRAQVRAAVDRRFYRSRYDARRTVEAFAARLRDEVELEMVDAMLVAVARDALRPTSAGLWIRDTRP